VARLDGASSASPFHEGRRGARLAGPGGPVGGALFTAPFVYLNTGYLLVGALPAIMLFGWLLERPARPASVPLVIFNRRRSGRRGARRVGFEDGRGPTRGERRATARPLAPPCPALVSLPRPLAARRRGGGQPTRTSLGVAVIAGRCCLLLPVAVPEGRPRLAGLRRPWCGRLSRASASPLAALSPRQPLIAPGRGRQRAGSRITAEPGTSPAGALGPPRAASRPAREVHRIGQQAPPGAGSIPPRRNGRRNSCACLRVAAAAGRRSPWSPPRGRSSAPSIAGTAAGVGTSAATAAGGGSASC